MDGLYSREIDEVEMESIKFSFTNFFVKIFGDEYPEFFLSWEKIALFPFFFLSLRKWLSLKDSRNEGDCVEKD